MAVTITVDSSTTITSCTTQCNTITCSEVGVTHTISCTSFTPITLKCNVGTTDEATRLKNSCKFSCNNFIAKLKMDIEDAESNISKNAFTKTACNALRIVTGGAGKTFATFAVIATGIGFFTGKVSWGLMIGVAAGIATMFGGPSIVAAISGQDTSTMCNIQD